MRIGFRDVQVVGTNRVYVNGRPIKAHGTTRHEAHPLAGRSLWGLEPAGKQWERDISLFRDTKQVQRQVGEPKPPALNPALCRETRPRPARHPGPAASTISARRTTRRRRSS